MTDARRLLVSALKRCGALVFSATLLWVAALWVGPQWFPGEPLSQRYPRSRQVLAADGSLMRMTLARDGQYRLWTPLQEISPLVVAAVKLKEDRGFAWHPGVDPSALLRAAWETARGGPRQGGSTLTMQLARKLYSVRSRTVTGKLRQIVAALWLEVRYTKRELLEAYLNLAPMGGNVEGVEAASQIYFGKRSAALTLHEAASLAVLPQSPTRRARFGHAMTRARQRLLRQWRQAHPGDERAAAPVTLEVGHRPRSRLPWVAPHAAEHLLSTRRGEKLESLIQPHLQRCVEEVLDVYLSSTKRRKIRNAAVLVVDVKSQAVQALVGSANYRDDAIEGQIDGTRARRSPGSTLKPLLYGLAFDQGLIHPKTLLHDAPGVSGAFAPDNYDGQFLGPITAEQALVRSRNVPAAWLHQRVSAPSLYDTLKAAKVKLRYRAEHYGPALALGGGELTARELATLYLAIATDGRHRSLRLLKSDREERGARLLSPAAAHTVRAMLRNNPRPDAVAGAKRDGRWPVAWKTGTSWGFHDAWTAGVVGPYVVVVWVGNFNNEPNAAFVGAHAAAPLFFRLTDALRLASTTRRLAADPPPKGLRQVEVCAESGELPNAWCPHRRETAYLPGVSPLRRCALHRLVSVDVRTGAAVCPSHRGVHIEDKVFAYWPSDLRALFRSAGNPQPTPPAPPKGCVAGGHRTRVAAPVVLSPRPGVPYTLRSAHGDDSLSLRARTRIHGGELQWYADARWIGSQRPEGALRWRPPKSGRFRLRACDPAGQCGTRWVSATVVP